MLKGVKNQKHFRKGSVSNYSTDQDSSFQTERTSIPIVHKLKTQLCKTFSIVGICCYGDKCRFAHGKQELVVIHVQRSRKHRMCNSFWKRGICTYGTRCQFGHAQVPWQTKAALLSLQQPSSPQQDSRLLNLLGDL